jgi:hypothetical protein
MQLHAETPSLWYLTRAKGEIQSLGTDEERVRILLMNGNLRAV